MLTFGTGVSSYYGDLRNPGDYIDSKLNLIVGAQIRPAPNFAGNRLHTRASLTWFRLEGDDKDASDDRVERNLSFYSNNVQLTTMGLFDVFPTDKKFYERPFFNIYGMAGIGLLYMNPKTEYQGEKVALQPLQTEGVNYSRFQFVIPYGIGIRFKQSLLYNISIEAIWHKTFTDYLDDVSLRNYPDPAILKSDLSRALSDRRRELDPNYPSKKYKKEDIWQIGVRGNPDRKDQYMLVNIKLDYFLPIDLFSDANRLQWIKRNKPRRR